MHVTINTVSCSGPGLSVIVKEKNGTGSWQKNPKVFSKCRLTIKPQNPKGNCPGIALVLSSTNLGLLYWVNIYVTE